MSDSEFETYGTDNVICPYCGHDNGGDDGDGPPSGEQQCDNEYCNKYFHCDPNFTVDYSTYKLDCRNGSPHDWSETYFASTDAAKGRRYCNTCCSKGEWVTK